MWHHHCQLLLSAEWRPSLSLFPVPQCLMHLVSCFCFFFLSCASFVGSTAATGTNPEQNRQEASEKEKMRGNKAFDLQLQTEKHFQCVWECVCCRGISSRPSSGNSLHPSSGRAGEERATPRGRRERQTQRSILEEGFISDRATEGKSFSSLIVL